MGFANDAMRVTTSYAALSSHGNHVRTKTNEAIEADIQKQRNHCVAFAVAILTS